MFAGVSFLVGAFVIWNTFNVLVAQRRREIALLRAVGATRRQILGGIITEAVVIGLVAAGLGLAAGVGLAFGIRQLLKLIGVEMPTTSPTLEPRTVLAAVLSVGSSSPWWPRSCRPWSATRVSPIEALREGDPTTERVSRRRRRLGWAMLGVGAAAMTVCAVVGDQPWATGAATLVTFVGLVLSGPSSPGMAGLADRGRRGTPHRMAARNIGRAPRRAAATALALTIGLSVVAAVAVAAASLKESVTEAVKAGNRSDFVVAPAGVSRGVSPDVADLLRDRSDVDTVVEFRYSGAKLDGDVVTVVGADGQGLGRTLDLGLRQGSLAASVRAPCSSAPTRPSPSSCTWVTRSP